MKRKAEQKANADSLRGGIRLGTINVTMIIIAAIASFLLLIAAGSAISSYQKVQKATNDYISAERDAARMQAASDYLTQQARVFTMTGDTERIELYYEEVHETRRRDIAVADIFELIDDPIAIGHLNSALEYSVALQNTEAYAMRLRLEADGTEMPNLPEEVAEVILTDEDLALTKEEQRDKAVDLMFNDAYLDCKDDISREVDLCTESLILSTRQTLVTSSDALLSTLRRQQILIGLLLLIVFAIVLMTSLLIIRPLRQGVQHLQHAEQMQPSGAYEMRYLADTYNEMMSRTMAHQDKLSYEASHDPLTGLYNRKAYERTLAELDEGAEVALIIVDVDYFKDINDTYGHETGDKVLQHVANTLQDNFRHEDAVCRIGGDEFAVIMNRMPPSLREMLENKLATIADQLREPKDGYPAVTLSIGAAFSKDGETDDEKTLFNRADAVLYEVKRTGRNGFRIA